MLSERQQHFRNEIDRECQRNGAWVISWPASRRVRFETLYPDVGEQLAAGFRRCGLEVYAIGKGERVIADGVMPSEVFEAVLPKDTPTPPQSHYGELADAAEKARRKRLGIR